MQSEVEATPWFDVHSWARWLDDGSDRGLTGWLADLATGWQPPHIPQPRIEDPDAWVASRAARSLAEGAWPHAVERLVRRAPGRTRTSVVFLHGFGATRAGGEAVVDAVADAVCANVYYPLLPGHGRTPEAHAEAPAEAYLAAAAAALAVGAALGERVLVIGSSTGGLLATWLAATWPDQVQALVLASPFFHYADPTAAWIVPLPMSSEAIEAAQGQVRDARFVDDPESRKLEGYDQNWLTEQRYASLAHLERLRAWIARDEVFARVACPTLLLYSPRDTTADVEAMHRAFGQMGPDPRSRFVPIEDGHHVLLSAYVRTDKARIESEILSFHRELGDEEAVHRR